jgi:branched-chain amino acid transport system substrate-binding protein
MSGHKNPDFGDSRSAEEAKAYSRRDFLKVAGVAGATVGLAGGLGGALVACGGETTTTTAAAPGTTTTAAAGTSETTAAASSSTTVTSAAAEQGREIKLGFVTPTTGGLAVFGLTDAYTVDHWTELLKDGVVCGDGKQHAIKIIKVDTQSDSNRAGQVAADLINNDKVDIVMCGATPDTVIPVSTQAEALEAPCLSTDCPWEAYFFGRNGDPKVGFKWTYHVQWGGTEMVTVFLDMWGKVPNNKTVGLLLPNDADGNTLRGLWPPLFEAAGYKCIDAGAYQNGTEDYSSIISLFKKEGAEVLTGAPLPTDFTNFWSQAQQQSYKPPVATVAKALLTSASVEALGPTAGVGLTSELWWAPTWPFKNSFNGETCQQLADDFEAKTGRQWNMPLLHSIVFEMAVDSLKRTTNVDDKNVLIDAITKIKIDSLGGPIDFTAPNGSALRPVPNVVVNPVTGGQWHKGTKWPYEIKIVSNASGKMIPTEVEIEPMPA